MEQRRVDVAIIGAGTAGLAAYRKAKAHTDNLVLIEAGPHGTTCARVGCMPSKLLIAAAEVAQTHREADLFGIESGPLQIDGARVMERVRRERDRFVGSVVTSVEKMPDAHKVTGRARFLDNHRLQIDNQQIIEADRIIIATGSSPNIPGFLKAAGDRLVVNDDVFEWQTLPEKVAVFGPGVIGLELGQALHRLGVEIRMFGVGSAIGPIQDPEIRDYAENLINQEFYMDPDAKVEQVEATDQGVSITYQHRDQGNTTETFDYLLAATGRRPNLDALDLGQTDIELDDKGIPLYDPYTLRCGDSSIFIAGDVNNAVPLLHEAADEGKIAGDNAGRFPEVRVGKRRTPLAIVFSDPQIATVGMNLHQVEQRCQQCYAIGQSRFDSQGRAKVIGKNKGMLNVYGEHGSGLFLGAEMFGPAAEHIGHLLSWAVQQKLTVSEILDMPFYHPVIEEGVRTALRDLNYKLQIGPESPENCLDCGPGA